MNAIQTGTNRQSAPGLSIRPVSTDDLADLHAIMTDRRVALNVSGLPTAEMVETSDWLEAPNSGLHRLVAELDNAVVGLATLQHYLRPRLTHSGEISIMVHHDHWGKGIGTALARALTEIADNWLNLRRLQATVLTNNLAAVSLANKVGFVVEGTREAVAFGNGRWLDDLMMARVHRTDNQAPGDVRRPEKPSASRSLAGKFAVEIRPIRPEDLEDFHQLMSHPQVCRTTLQMPSQEISLSVRRIEAENPGLHRLVAVVDGTIVGVATLHQNRNPRMLSSAGLGMSVHPAYWGKRIGSRLLEAVLDLADNWLDLKRVELDVNTDNPAGIRLYEKHGFVHEGTKRCHAFGDGRMADSFFMARIRDNR